LAGSFALCQIVGQDLAHFEAAFAPSDAIFVTLYAFSQSSKNKFSTSALIKVFRLSNGIHFCFAFIPLLAAA
jgi:hypothetical protein